LTLDTWVTARLASELDDALSGARVESVSCSATRLALTCYRRSGPVALVASLDPQGPIVAAVSGDAIANENGPAGWAGGVAPLLRGSTIDSVRVVPNDRIIHVDLRSRSAFGVPARHRVVLELEPLKANALVLRPADDETWRILAAARQVIGRGDARDVTVGETYEPPPVRKAQRDADSFCRAIAVADPSEARVLARLLGEYDHGCTQPLAREVVDLALAPDPAPDDLGPLMLREWTSLRERVERAVTDLRGPVYVWMRQDAVALCHLVRLSWPPGDAREALSCNDCCVVQLRADERHTRAPDLAALRKRLATLLRRCEEETAKLARTRTSADESDALRAAGESIYAYLAQIPERAASFTTPEGLRIELDPSLTAKENAAAYFRRLKKARTGMPRVAERLAVLASNRERWEQLLWELDRAEAGSTSELAATCDEVATALGTRSTARRTKQDQKVKTPRSVDLGDGAVAFVGRSPKDNERVTFVIAGPDDLWFHARGIPGAHVVIKAGDGRALPTQAQILAAASLAAGQSRAADATKVEVDFTRRKHVRKQGGGRTGLVWYTDFQTVLVAPRKLPPSEIVRPL
jgi:predicted ribosome quality control (RQC) complex YloA/Tae2 family protein